MNATFKPEITRNDRMYNIATAIINLHAANKKGTRSSTLRDHIRTELRLPEIHGEEKLGDLRAHGDAIGGHGLRLVVERKTIDGKKERVVMFTHDTLTKCQNFIKTYENEGIF